MRLKKIFGIQFRTHVTRFAPSPTGSLHLGGLRTALFNYLLAHKNGGKFHLRIEDTDQTRTIPGSKEEIMNLLEWSMLNYEPTVLVQSERKEIYQKYAKILIDNGAAYKCYCTPERLEHVRAIQKKAKGSGYDRRCLNLTNEEKLELKDQPYTVRFKVPLERKFTIVDDMVHGKVKVATKTLDDMILLKSDGLPTYHLANVVDDHLMGITHVLRGDEWIPSTPKHICLYEAFGWTPPKFAHLPLLMRKDGSKLSKRQNDVHVSYFKDNGYLPEALLNFVALLGWSPGTTKEFFTLPELVENFDMSNINKGNCMVSYDKLDYLNKLHIGSKIENDLEFVESIKKEFFLNNESKVIDKDKLGIKSFQNLLSTVKNRANNLAQIQSLIYPLLCPPDYATPQAVKAKEKLEATKLREIPATLFDKLDIEWSRDALQKALNEYTAEHSLAFMELMKYTRYVICGTSVGIDLITTMLYLGKEETRNRLKYHQ
ncbi:Glutamyl-tRNA synthetase [Boothiomyces sp. JEL0866]|nr:Glutamyl-tRNA synthetase [Boothiomyces sp. JEL0866]